MISAHAKLHHLLFIANRYLLQFDRESKAELEARKKQAREPLEYVGEVCSLVFKCVTGFLKILALSFSDSCKTDF